MKAVLLRELRAHFRSPLSLICMALILCLSGVLFTAYDLTLGYSGLDSILPNLLLGVALILPVYGLRLFGKQSREGSDLLLRTLPISHAGSILGIYLAALIPLLLCTAVLALYPLILAVVATVSIGTVYLQLLAFLLCEATLLALVLLCYALCENRLKAILLCYGLLLLWFFAGVLAGLLPWEIAATLIRRLSIFYCFDHFAFGLFDLGALLLFVSMTVLFVLLAIPASRRSKAKEEGNPPTRGRKLLVALVAAALILCNLPFAFLPARAYQLDITSSGKYGVSEEIEDFLRGLDTDVTVYRLNVEDETFRRFTDRLCQLSPRLTLVDVNVDKNPEFLKKYNLTADGVLPGSLILESGLRHRYLPYTSLFTYSNTDLGWNHITYAQYVSYEYQLNAYYQYYASSSSGSSQAESYAKMLFSLYYSTTTGFSGGYQIASSVEYVTAEKIPTIYYLTGHGEVSPDSSVLDDKVLDAYEAPVESLNLTEGGEVPANAAALLINKPASDLSESELGAILRYAEGGGKLMLLTDSDFYTLENFARLTERYGMSVSQGVVQSPEVDKEGNKGELSPWVITAPNIDHDALAAYEKASTSQLPHIMEGSAIELDKKKSDVLVSALLTSPADAKVVIPDVTTESGAQILGAAAETEGGTRFVWLTGARTFNEDNYLDSNNTSLLMYLLSWTGEFYTSSLTSPEPVLYTMPNLGTTTTNVALFGILLIVILPAGTVALGLTVRYRRRHRMPKTDQ